MKEDTALKKHTTIYRLRWTAVLTAICVGGGIFFGLSSQNLVGLLVNIVTFVLMYIVIGFGLGEWNLPWRSDRNGIHNLELLTVDFQQATDQIKRVSDENPTESLEEHFTSDGLFQESCLAAHFHEFCEAYQHLPAEQQSFHCCDISDYINESIFDEAGHTAYNDLVGGVLTGLGILGTFVGLAFGLNGFNSTNATTMQQTIPPLIEGIKVAFYTSIAGVTLSIFDGFLYRNRMRTAEDALSRFQTTFYELVLPRPDNEGFTKLMEYQSKQTDSMSQFAEDISIALAKQLNGTLPTAIAEAVSGSLIPSLQGIESNMSVFADKMASNQMENLDKIVQNFVSQMNEAMGNQLIRLGTSIQQICEWQETTFEHLQQIAGSVCVTHPPD